MVRRHVVIPNEDDRFIRNLPGKASEHFRRAISDYIERQKNMDAVTSPKAMKILRGGEEVSI